MKELIFSFASSVPVDVTDEKQNQVLLLYFSSSSEVSMLACPWLTVISNVA